MVSDPAQLFLPLLEAPTCCPCQHYARLRTFPRKEPGPAPPHPRWGSTFFPLSAIQTRTEHSMPACVPAPGQEWGGSSEDQR